MNTININKQGLKSININLAEFPLPNFRYYLHKGDIISFKEAHLFTQKVGEDCERVVLLTRVKNPKFDANIEFLFSPNLLKFWAYDYEGNLVNALNGVCFSRLLDGCKTFADFVRAMEGRTLRVASVVTYKVKQGEDVVTRTLYGFDLR